LRCDEQQDDLPSEIRNDLESEDGGYSPIGTPRIQSPFDYEPFDTPKCLEGMYPGSPFLERGSPIPRQFHAKVNDIEPTLPDKPDKVPIPCAVTDLVNVRFYRLIVSKTFIF
jgi:hypothetical protein